jgi:hypothetical protein
MAFRLYQGQRHVVLDCSAGPLDVSGRRARDVVVRVAAAVASEGAFETDANGLHMQPRQGGARPWAPVYGDPTEPVATNFYPTTAIAGFGDDTTHVSVLADSSYGVGAVPAGGAFASAIDIMVQRAWFRDAKVEPPNTPFAARLLLLVDAPQRREDRRRPLSWQMLSPLLLAAASGPLGPAIPPLAPALPAELQLLSLQRLPSNLSSVLDDDAAAAGAVVFLVRIAHVFPADGSTHGPASVDLAALLPSLHVVAAEELTVDGVRPLAAARAARLQWRRQGLAAQTHHDSPSDSPKMCPDGSIMVKLQPLQVRTFQLVTQ